MLQKYIVLLKITIDMRVQDKKAIKKYNAKLLNST